MKNFLFPFVFDCMTINDNITKWLQERKINFFYNMETLYADIFGTNEFFRIETEHVVNNIHEVFFCTNNKREYPFPSRRFPTEEKVHPVPNIFNTVKVIFANGDSIATTVCGDKISVETFYLNNLFQVNGDKNKFQKAVKVEFISVSWEEIPKKDISPRCITFSSLFPDDMGKELDQYFSDHNWKLEYCPAISGYQVFFGTGIQVDNQYEYGFPYSYSKEELG